MTLNWMESNEQPKVETQIEPEFELMWLTVFVEVGAEEGA